MPWKEKSKMEERLEFVRRYEAGERMTELARFYGVSRRTGYKFVKRYKAYGEAGLDDRSSRPHRIRYEVSEEMKMRLISAREKHPTWGAKKLKAYLERELPGVRVPAWSTIHALLDKHGYIRRRKRRRPVSVYPHQLQHSRGPNDIWCADFKGQFRLANGQLCYPLTVTDHYSRKILACEGFRSIDGENTARVFSHLFETYGLPRVIRTDNGSPFASQAIAGLSRLNVWWLKLGIVPERIEPGHPEQNGRHERMHRTLKEEATRPAEANILAQQERFEHFVHEFNTIRPHEALEMRTPDELYTPSERTFEDIESSTAYALDDLVVTVGSSGHIRAPGLQTRFFLSSVLAGCPIGLRELPSGRWLASYMRLPLGHFQIMTNDFQPFEIFDYTHIHNNFLPAAA